MASAPAFAPAALRKVPTIHVTLLRPFLRPHQILLPRLEVFIAAARVVNEDSIRLAEKSGLPQLLQSGDAHTAFRSDKESLFCGELLAGAHHVVFGDRDCGAPAVSNSPHCCT